MRLDVTAVKPAFEDDLVALIKSEGGDQGIARKVFELLAHIARGELSGLPLEAHGGTGNVSDCRKVYFDLDPKAQPRFRLVYRLQPDEKNPARVQAVAVGYRANLDAYVRAARNLGR